MSIEVMRSIKVRLKFESALREQFLKGPLRFLADYELTEEEKWQIIVPHFSWLEAGKVAALSYPLSVDAFIVLRGMGIRALLNLAEMPLPVAALKNAGLLAEHIPIVDYSAPMMQQIEQALAMIKRCVNSDMPVGVHCVAGLGRTGTILACYLVERGSQAHDAIEAIRAWRPGSIEGVEQETAIHQYSDKRKKHRHVDKLVLHVENPSK